MRMRRAGPEADPAPPRWRYRMQRLWLTPAFRAFVRRGLPGLAITALLIWYVADPARLAGLRAGWDDAVETIRNRPEFTVSSLRIDGASEGLTARIETALPVELPVSQFDLDMDALRARLLKLDAIAAADLHVRAGGVLEVRVEERLPAIVWMQGGRIVTLDATGHRVARLENLDAAGPLPVMAGERANARVPEALRLIEAAAPVADRLIGLVRVGNRRWDVLLTRDQRIALPEVAPVAALDRALALHAAQDVLSRDVAVVDLRLADRPVLRLSERARAALRVEQDARRLSYTEDR
jgi:cell division protein FtsQ